MKRPTCLDCGERDRRKFYAHPTSQTGVQSRCKRCDNAKRIAYQRAARDERLHDLELVAGVEGMAVYLDGYRIAGPKPWGGGVRRHAWRVQGHEIRTALRRGEKR